MIESFGNNDDLWLKMNIDVTYNDRIKKTPDLLEMILEEEVYRYVIASTHVKSKCRAASGHIPVSRSCQQTITTHSSYQFQCGIKYLFPR